VLAGQCNDGLFRLAWEKRLTVTVDSVSRLEGKSVGERQSGARLQAGRWAGRPAGRQAGWRASQHLHPSRHAASPPAMLTTCCTPHRPAAVLASGKKLAADMFVCAAGCHYNLNPPWLAELGIGEQRNLFHRLPSHCAASQHAEISGIPYGADHKRLVFRILH
jgi:hypothetical protein